MQTKSISNYSKQHFLEKWVQFIIMLITKLFKRNEMMNSVTVNSFISFKKRKNISNIIDPIIDPDASENIVLDLYYLEGMKLFNQGVYAKNIIPKTEIQSI